MEESIESQSDAYVSFRDIKADIGSSEKKLEAYLLNPTSVSTISIEYFLMKSSLYLKTHLW